MEMERGASVEAAAARVRASTIFTTHTPLPAGTDVFLYPLMQRYFDSYLSQLGVARDAFFQLGANPLDPGAGFNMTVFALRMAEFRNAVSQRHAQVARRMWSIVFPDQPPEQPPIVAITNGVHLPGWIEPTRLQPLLDQYLGPDWRALQDERAVWDARIFRLAQDPQIAGRIAFVEDYDEPLAQYLVHGVDVWLNNPLPPLEASGTSGMKASVNGTPNLSILDGWWIEGYDGAISAQRMVKQYVEQFYVRVLALSNTPAGATAHARAS